MLPFLSLSYILQVTRHNRDSALVTKGVILQSARGHLMLAYRIRAPDHGRDHLK